MRLLLIIILLFLQNQALFGFLQNNPRYKTQSAAAAAARTIIKNSNLNEIEKQQKKTNLEIQKLQLELQLNKLDKLQNEKDLNNLNAELRNIQNTIELVESKTKGNQMDTTNNNKNLTEEEIQNGIKALTSLPQIVTNKLAEVSNINSLGEEIDYEALLLSLYESREMLLTSPDSPIARQGVTIQIMSQDGKEVKKLDKLNEEEILSLLLSEDNEESDALLRQATNIRYFRNFYSDVAKREEIADVPKEEDVRELMASLSKVFNVNVREYDEVPGGFLVRGTNLMTNGDELISKIEQEIEKTGLELNVAYVRDPSIKEEERDMAFVDPENLWGEPVLLFTTSSQYVSPIQPAFGSFLTLIALIGTLIFSVSSFEQNQVVFDRLQEANAVGDYNLQWFNEILIPVVLSILTTQFAHEFGHILVSIRDGFKSSVPTVIPAPNLPFLTSQTAIKTSPKNLKSLFDFALAGPFCGFMTSLALLFAGLYITNTADSEMYSQFPGLSVDFLKSSSLGGYIVNYMMGNDLFTADITPSNTVVPLHPFAIGGFVGIISNALSLLPVGRSDGGRIALSVFGRNGLTLVNAFTNLAVLAAAIVGFDPLGSLLTFGIFILWTNREMDIPCKNEIDDLDLVRSLFAILGSVVVLLTLIPIR